MHIQKRLSIQSKNILFLYVRKSSPQTKVKKGKEARTWNNGGSVKDASSLDYSSAGPAVSNGEINEVSEQDVSV